jgi:hypothetical protein
MNSTVQNINGIIAANDFAAVSELSCRADEDRVDILFLAETSLNWLDNRQEHGCKSHLQYFWKPMKLLTAASSITHGSAYQPGGVATIVGGNWVNRISKATPDTHDLGRWTTCSFQGKENTHLTIITAYQPCKDDIGTTGPKPASRQQWALLRQARKDLSPDPRK